MKICSVVQLGCRVLLGACSLVGVGEVAKAQSITAPYPVPGLPFWDWKIGQPTGFGLREFNLFNDSVIIAVGGHGTAVRTTNGGRSWLTLPTGVNRDLTSVSFADASTGWIGSETEPSTSRHYRTGAGRVLRTTDGGQSWVAQSIGEPVLSVETPLVEAVSATEAYVAYGLTGRQLPPNSTFIIPPTPVVRHTTNSGQSWSVVPLPLSNGIVMGGKVLRFKFLDAATGYILLSSRFGGTVQLLRTANHGQSWQDVQFAAATGGIDDFLPADFSFLDAQRGWVSGFAPSVGAALLRTTDGGQSWTSVAVPAANAAYGVSFANSSSGMLYDSYNTYVTTDGGATWTIGYKPDLFFENFWMPRLRTNGTGEGWAVGSNGGLYVTADAGRSWQSKATTQPVRYLTELAFPDPTHGWGLLEGGGRSILRTTNRGNTWQQLRVDLALPGITPANADYFGVHLYTGAFPDADTVWAAGSIIDTTSRTYTGLLARSTNGGTSWVRQELEPGALAIDAMAAWNTRRAVALHTYSRSLRLTYDGGRHWTPAYRPAPRRRLNRAVWADSATIYITTDSLVFLKSVTAGRTWQQLPLPTNIPLGSFQSLTFTSAITGYFGDGQGVWKTTNGGSSWQYTDLTAFSSPNINGGRDPGLYGISFATAQVGQAFGQNDVFRTEDAGQTWTHAGYVGGLYGTAAGLFAAGVALDRYNAFGAGSGLTRYSEKFVQVDTTLAPLAYCAGQTLSLEFTTTGSFAGESRFVAQLSNYMGRFRAGETRVVGAGTGSPLSVTLPADVSPGTHYRLRVVQAEGLVLGGDNGHDLLITPPAPAATLALLPSGALQATLPVGSTIPDHYEWERGGQPVGGQTAAQLAAPTAGNYRVRACTAACCGPWSAVVVVAPDLVVSTTQSVQGTYRSVRITGPATGGAGVATLTGPLTVLGSLMVQPGGTLLTACQPLTGPGSFALDSAATLFVCDPAGISASGATGAVQLTGSRSFSPLASYFYNGTQPQVTGSGLPGQVRNLTIDNGGAGLTQTQATSVTQVLRLTAGDLHTGGHALTLLSGPAGTALIDNTGGVVHGVGTMQRYLTNHNPAGRGYRHYSAPVSNTTLADLGGTGYTPVLNPAFNTSATPGLVSPYPTLFGYDQGRLTTSVNNAADFDKGWYVPTGLGEPMPIGQGFTANVSDAAVVDFTGNFTSGPVTLTNLQRGLQPEAGWQLVGNPYPSPLDWSLVASAQRQGLDAAAYAFQSTGPYTGTYRACINGFGNPLIVAGSGFFVRVSAANTTATLALTNAHRVTTFGSQPVFGRGAADTRPRLHLLVHGAGVTDETRLYFEAGATPGVDAAYDATKLLNSTGLNLASLTGIQALAINGLPLLSSIQEVIPLALDIPQAGRFEFEVDELANFGSTTVHLRDALTGVQQVVTPGMHYSFTLSTATAGRGRFSLVFRPAGALANAEALTATTVYVYPNPAHDRLWLVLPPLPGVAQAQVTLLNGLGQAVRRIVVPLRPAGGAAELDVQNLAPGVYAVRVEGAGQQYTQRVVLE